MGFYFCNRCIYINGDPKQFEHSMCRFHILGVLVIAMATKIERVICRRFLPLFSIVI